MEGTATLARRIQEAELKQKQIEIQSKECYDAVSKISALRLLLVETIIEGKDDAREWRSILCPSDAHKVTNKLMELVDKL